MTMLRTAVRQLACLSLLGATTSVLAQQTDTPDRNLTGFEAADMAQPLWEFGAGGGFIEVPNYPASSERNFISLVLPYFIYRGDVFRIGDGSARTVLIEDSDFEFDFSIGGAFSADSDDNTAREGMPELDYLFEIGPQLLYRLQDFDFDGGGSGRLNLRVQARAAFSTDFKRVDSRGYVFQPELSYQQRGVLFEETALNTSLSLVFATEKLHDYFYQVDPQFATDTRERYDASGGFLGAELSAGFSFPIRTNIRGFVGGTLRFHHGAANEESPLFEEDITYSIGAGFVWRFYKSEAVASW